MMAVRWQAELDNYRKRARREMDEQSRYAALPLLQDILGVVDNLQRAIEPRKTRRQKIPSRRQPVSRGVKMVAAQMAGV